MPPVSYADVTPGNMELTPCRLKWQPPGGGGFVDLGGTLGNVAVKFKYEKAEIKADQFGSTVLDRRIKGMMCTIETEIAEVQLKDNWMTVFPNADKTGTSPADYLDFFSKIGASDLAQCGQLLLHPLSKDDADLNYDIFAYLACASEESEYIFAPDKQSTLKLVWNIYLDMSTSPARFIRVGDRNL